MIPGWNISAVLPPVRPGASGHSIDRSPYKATMSEVVERFGTSAERLNILRGLLAYRAAVLSAGVEGGFQWLNGSFVEDKELLLGVPPGDIDVVTFLALPARTDERTFLNANLSLFDSDQTSTTYRVDAYAFVLNNPMTSDDIRQISYWYSMWSHRRNGVWKGFVEVDFSPEQDQLAGNLLADILRERASA